MGQKRRFEPPGPMSALPRKRPQ